MTPACEGLQPGGSLIGWLSKQTAVRAILRLRDSLTLGCHETYCFSSRRFGATRRRCRALWAPRRRSTARRSTAGVVAIASPSSLSSLTGPHDNPAGPVENYGRRSGVWAHDTASGVLLAEGAARCRSQSSSTGETMRTRTAMLTSSSVVAASVAVFALASTDPGGPMQLRPADRRDESSVRHRLPPRWERAPVVPRGRRGRCQ